MTPMVHVRPATVVDAEAWRELRLALWPEEVPGEHADAIAAFFAGKVSEPLAVLLAVEGQEAVGFLELSIRAYAEGCRSDRVAYVEGWYVAPRARGRRVGRALVAAAEEWGRAQGCTELASDAEAENELSASAHRALGFTEVGLVRCFRKDL